jgi:hypothetical protein
MIRIACIVAVFVFLYACSSQNSTTVHSSPTVVDLPKVVKSKWYFDGEEGVQFVTPNWNIHTTISIPRIVDSLPDFYSDLLGHYTTVFGDLPYPQKRIDVFMFATETQWQLKLREMLGADAKDWYSLGRGGLTVDGTGVLYHLDKRGRSRVTLRIAAHEGWHQYAEAVFENCLPTWLDEGIGTWMEGFRIRNGEVNFTPASNWDRLSTLRKIVSADKLDSLNTLLTSEPSALLSTGRSTLLSYYAQLWALTSFIVEFDNGKYLPRLHAVLASALEGTLKKPRGGWMFAFTYNPIQMEREYKGWVVQYVRPGSTWR